MSDITKARKAVVARILEGAGDASHALRRAAFDNVFDAATGKPRADVVPPPRTIVLQIAT